MKKRIINFSKKYKLEIILISISLIYYLYFSNKGIVLYDEGYYVHVAERILQGEIPYKDFALQYTPGYFYVLAAFFRIFGEQLYVGRILSMLFCIGIIIMVFAILNKVRVRSTLIKILSFLAIVAFGYPLMNIPIIAWAGVFIVTGIMYCVISYSKEKRVENKTNIIIVLGCLLALLLLFKQNLGAVYVLLVNGILLLKSGETFRNKIKHLLIINGFFAVISFFG